MAGMLRFCFQRPFRAVVHQSPDSQVTADRNEALSQPLSFTGNNQQATTNNPSLLASPAYLTPRLPKSLLSSQLSLFPSLPQPTLLLLAVSKNEKYCFTLGLISAEPPGARVSPPPPRRLWLGFCSPYASNCPGAV